MVTNRRIPPDFPADNPSAAERRFYQLFGEDEGCRGMVLIHSLFLSAHTRRSFGEVDFIILTPGKGVFLLEVKGGGIQREDGIWYTTGRDGISKKLNKGPIEQLKDTMFSLQDWLGKALGNDRVKRRFKPMEIEGLQKIGFGYGLVLPSNDELPIDDPTWESWMLYLRKDTRQQRSISAFVNRLAHGFGQKSIWKREGAIPDQKICDALEKLLVGDFEVRYELIARLQDDTRVIEELTHGQLEVLAHARFNERCFFQGGAGTGKTVLAVALFAEQVAAGRRTALFCFNRLLADHLREQVKKNAPDIDLQHHYIGTLDAFMLGVVKMKVPDDPEEKERFFHDLPWEFIDAASADHEQIRFDHVIVDEAQDVLSEDRLMVLDAMLAGGLKTGKWTFFGDLSRQLIYQDETVVQAAVEQLRTMTGFYMSPPLSINCRNTQRIARNNQKLTGGSEPRFLPGAPEGEAVDYFFPATQSQRTSKLVEIITTLHDQGIKPDEVVILSPLRDALKELEADPAIQAAKGKGLRLLTIHEFKGLESKVVILTGFRSLGTPADQMLLYVGSSKNLLTTSRTGILTI